MKTLVTEIPNMRDFFKGRSMLRIGCPWLTFGAIMTLERIVNKKMKVLELGGGGSTVFFSNNCQSVKTFETNKVWADMLKEKLAWINNVDIIWTENEAGSVEAIKKEIDILYDIILIDSGFTGNHVNPNRRLLFETALPKLKQGGFIIIDNYQHYGMRHFDYKGFEVYTYDEIGYSGRGTKICQKL